ncbi:DUF2597 family protein [Pasteurella skyensis]|uniref:DUF2597 family protein n=1 Tax=Phocoenobacter skyensis TaxID=97481 RepID=A0AAJ6NBB4_9PAST|nr:phage protein [Pasteurella skyensis]MDP8173679.1 DUF2597 family protein [Pasteurella skyensis]MDP8178047.1 DUF2597 family protein [Pasteurella skyensis]
MERISGQSFDITIGLIPFHVESASLTINDNTAVAQTRGIPDGYIFGDVSADGEIELDEKNFKKISTLAAASGSYRDIPCFDLTFFASRGGVRAKVEAFECKFMPTDLINIDPKGGSKSGKKIKFFVTSPDFVNIDGVPYLSKEDTRDLVG